MKKFNKKIILISVISIICIVVSIFLGYYIFNKYFKKTDLQVEQNVQLQEESNILSQSEAETLLLDLYDKASQLYGSKAYTLNKNNTIKINNNEYYLVEDFYQVAQKYLTIGQIDKIKEGHPNMYIKNGLIYVQDKEKTYQYQNLKITKLEVNEDSISAVVSMDVYVNGNLKSEGVSSNMKVIKSDSEWLIDEYYDLSEMK